MSDQFTAKVNRSTFKHVYRMDQTVQLLFVRTLQTLNLLGKSMITWKSISNNRNL